MDSYSEQLIYKYPDGKDTAKKILIYVCAGLVACVTILFTIPTIFASIGLLVGAGAIWLGYYLGTNQHIEYEYIITNGEIDIDKIIGKRKRSRLITVKVSSFTDYGMLTNDVKDNDNLTLVLASDNVGNADWYADFENEKYGSTRLIFTPNQEFRDCIKPFLKNSIRLKK